MLWLSLGENCLTDDILRRHGKKSFSTPYSPCRSNVDYALMLEESWYYQFLDPLNLVAGESCGEQVIWSTSINQCESLYHEHHMNGFEFTHHDPLNSEVDRESYLRKIDRLNDVRGKEDLVFFYHHRKVKNSDLNSVKKKLDEFSRYYKGKHNKVVMILFHQCLVSDVSERRVELSSLEKSVIEFTFYTKDIWGGSDKEIFWARVDDDLISEMIEKVSSLHTQVRDAELASA